MKNKIFTNKPHEIDKRSAGIPLRFKLLNLLLNAFFKDWTILKDVIINDNEIITKNLAPVYGSNVYVKIDTITIAEPDAFNKEMALLVK